MPWISRVLEEEAEEDWRMEIVMAIADLIDWFWLEAPGYESLPDSLGTNQQSFSGLVYEDTFWLSCCDHSITVKKDLRFEFQFAKTVSIQTQP